MNQVKNTDEIEPPERKDNKQKVEIPLLAYSPESTKEIVSPRKATFGSVKIQEDLQSDLLTQHEKKLYHGGFVMLEDVVGSVDDNVIRMVLTNPDVVSGIVGLQPLVSMNTAEAGVIYQAFRGARINFNQDYSLLEFGKEKDFIKILVNDRAAEHVLKTYQHVLGISIPERTLEKDEILNFTTQLLGSTDLKRANLAHGLLSGFPLEDCQYWIEGGKAQLNPISQLKKIGDVDNRFGDQTITDKTGKKVTGKWNPIPNLDPDDYLMTSSKNHFLPDTRASLRDDPKGGIVEGFGLRWSSVFPPRDSTVKHCQKLLQVDREVGLLNFVNNQRNTFRVEDNIKALGIEKQMFSSRSGLKAKTMQGMGAAFGIFVLFNNLARMFSQSEEEEKFRN